MSSVVLSLRGFSVRLGERLILAEIDLDIGRNEILVVMGPGGAGKSTLLRTICGYNDGHRDIQLGGAGEYLGHSLTEVCDTPDCRPALVEQSPSMMIATVFEFLAKSYPQRSKYTRVELKVRLTGELERAGVGELANRFDDELLDLTGVERRLLMLAAAVLARPTLLCVDEPTAGLEDSEVSRIISFLEAQKVERSLLMVTHNQRHGRQISDYTALLAGGKIQEHAPTDEFFASPQTDVARAFIRTGSCTVASPEACPEELEPAYLEEPPFPRGKTPVDIPSLRIAEPRRRRPALSENRGPYGFHWMRPGQLAGTPMPGVVRAVDDDLKALRRVEVNVLVTLTLKPLDSDLLETFHLEAIHFPIIDMHPPTVEAAAELCSLIEERLQAGDVIAFHCQAGIGRTGTMLAAYEIFQGMSAEDAFRAARNVHPRWIQSRSQREFLTEFELWLE